jgi:hypothetical protein
MMFISSITQLALHILTVWIAGAWTGNHDTGLRTFSVGSTRTHVVKDPIQRNGRLRCQPCIQTGCRSGGQLGSPNNTLDKSQPMKGEGENARHCRWSQRRSEKISKIRVNACNL